MMGYFLVQASKGFYNRGALHRRFLALNKRPKIFRIFAYFAPGFRGRMQSILVVRLFYIVSMLTAKRLCTHPPPADPTLVPPPSPLPLVRCVAPYPPPTSSFSFTLGYVFVRELVCPTCLCVWYLRTVCPVYVVRWCYHLVLWCTWHMIPFFVYAGVQHHSYITQQ